MAVYNNGFPIGYQSIQMPYYPQPQFQQPQYQQQVQQQAQQSPQMMTPPTIRAEIVQVDNEQAAANYPVAVGTPQMMMAKDDSAIYVKTAYANGQYQLDVFQKRPPRPQTPPVDMAAYVTRDEFERRLSGLTRGSDKPSNEVVKEGADE